MQQTLVLDQELIGRYDQSGPRYTSYPTAVQFHDGFGPDEYRNAARASNASGRPLSLYFHIPFCDTVCFYCACNKIATKDRGRAQPYLNRVHREIEMQAGLFDASRPVEQLHWGGGTPTFISPDQMRELMQTTRRHFALLDDDSGEYSIEIDPREVTDETIGLLREIGFNRMSLGLQDLEERVQKAVNRIQTAEQTFGALRAARREGFRSVSMDLIYGLPLQTPSSFLRTLDRVLDAEPDRLSVFNYAHLPERFKPQRRINEAELPTPDQKLEILQNVGERLASAGYVYIGMDHFARPDDELAVAQREGQLYRNFQGYSTHAHCDLIALGVTSIGMVGDTYAQNMRTLDEYYARIDAGELAVFRGIQLNEDDQLRRDVITQLICNFALDMNAIGERWGIEFATYFASELTRLAGMATDGLLQIDDARIEVLPAGRLLIRNICMVFDRYLGEPSQSGRFSKVI
ncbi:MAG: oxygen-independent coproporphyrinogen III oxidase [Gammaproteobacteria bacterium]|nr:oxygen-independent coproporphyrinogen III oxidase [Gammaproteobacteria bacterium]MCP5299241.1 oxygen-independent coproporphyrinogen III oxidase [Chromatiaceae bacterium]